MRSPCFIVGVSGGSDSVALLHILKMLRLQCIVAHVNHFLRGKDADQDEIFVKKLAKNFGFPCYTKKTHVAKYAKQKKLSLEAAGRAVRYEFFRALKKKFHARAIVTAHHNDDNLETMLWNMIRGAGIEGAKGMAIQEGDLLRPLLTVSKSSLLDYCKAFHLAYRVDRTNEDTLFTRNFIRKKLLPEMETLNPRARHSLTRFQRHLAEISEFLSAQTEKTFFDCLIKKSLPTITLNRKKFTLLPSLLQKMVFRKCFELLKGPMLEEKHYDELLAFLRGPSGKKKEYGKLSVSLQKNVLVMQMRI